jgi:pimeloyl-ACP methyl ester carboxylesterase
VIEGAAPRRLVLAGMGLEGLAGWERRAAFFLDAIARFDSVKHGDPAFMAVSFMKTMKVDREAARLLLRSVDDLAPAQLAAITMPTMVLCGAQDRDNGDPFALAAALPQGEVAEIPGTHMSSVGEPALGRMLVSFLTG